MAALVQKDRSSQLWSLAILLITYATFPVVMTYVFWAALWHRLVHGPKPKVTMTGKTAIVTGGKMTKALCVARQLKAAGCRVILVETHKYYMVASRFSECVDKFVTVPVPEQDPKGFLSAIKQLAYLENADLFVPVSSPVSSVYDAQVGSVLPAGCRSLSTGETWTAALDDKVTFHDLGKMAGLPVPDTRRLTSKDAALAFNAELRAKEGTPEGGKQYIFKNLQYDSMRRLDLFTLPCEPAKLEAYMADIDEISTNAPWAAQAYVRGQEYSTCAIAHKGAMVLYTANKASISCFNYEHDDNPKLRNWVETFITHHRLTGVVCIDFFIDEATGTPLAIECNPRFSSNIANFYDSPSAARAFLEPEACAKDGIIETPLPSAREACWIGFELYDALLGKGRTPFGRVSAALESLFVKKDAYYEPDDVLPFLALYYVHIPTLLMRNIRRGNKWAKIDLCIGKLTEVNGD